MIKLRTLALRAALAACLAAGLPLEAGQPGRDGRGEPPWWHGYPIYVGDADSGAVTLGFALDLRATMVSGNFGADPGWGPYGQAASFLQSAARFQQFSAAGVRWITWMEAFGESMLYAAALERNPNGSFRHRPDAPDMAGLVRQAWSWESDGARPGNAFRWVGLHNTVNDEDFVLPKFWRQRIGFPMPKYPDGRDAAGHLAGLQYPLSARVFDAVCAKDINGRPAVEVEALPPKANRLDPATGRSAASVEGLYRIELDQNLARYFPDRKVGDVLFASVLKVGKDPAAPFWIDYARAMVRPLLARGVDGLWCDNCSPFNNFGMPPIRNGFGLWSEQRFREQLPGTFSAKELLELGIENPAGFDIKAYLKRKAAQFGAADPSSYGDPAWRDPRWLDDPVWNAYKVFKQRAGQEALRSFYEAIKAEARAAGRDDFLVAGNDMPVYSLGWARDAWIDMVSSEQTPGWFVTTGARGVMLPPLGKYAAVYRAALEHQRGPYATAWYYLKGPQEKYRGKPALAKVLWAEAFANATFLKYGGNPAYPGTPESAAWWNKFVHGAEDRFGSRRLRADVGLYFSPDNQLACVVPGSHALDHDRQPHSFGHWGFATAMIDAHVPYRVVTDWKLSAEALADFKTFIVPGAECLDEREAAVLEAWARGGGRLVVTGPCGARHSTAGRFARRTAPLVLRWFSGITFDGTDFQPAPADEAAPPAGTRSTLRLVERPLGEGRVAWSPQPLGMQYYVHETERWQRLPELASLIGPSELVDAEGLAATVGLFLWQSEDGRALFADLVNYDLDLEADRIAPASNLSFRLRLPEGWQRAGVETIAPDDEPPATAETRQGWVSIRLPRLVHYASVKITRSGPAPAP